MLVWGVVRLFAGEPAEIIQEPAPVLNGSAGLSSADAWLPDSGKAVAKAVPLTLVAAQADSNVVVRDGSGAVVFSGEMVLGEKKRLTVTPPIRVRADDGGAIEVQVQGKDRGPLGVFGEPGRRTFNPDG